MKVRSITLPQIEGQCTSNGPRASAHASSPLKQHSRYKDLRTKLQLATIADIDFQDSAEATAEGSSTQWQEVTRLSAAKQRKHKEKGKPAESAWSHRNS